MAGIDIPIPELQLIIHVPTIKEIALMGETKFFMAVQYLCLDKESLIQDETLLSSLTNFQVLMKVLEQSQDKDKKNAIIMLLTLLFPEYTPIITRNSIMLNKMADKETNIIYNPANDRAKEIAEKLMRGRKKVAEIKSKGNNESVLTRYISILTIGTNTMSIEDCLNLNMFQIFDLMERYSAFVEWDVDLRVRLAGGKPDKPVESWMRDIHPKN